MLKVSRAAVVRKRGSKFQFEKVTIDDPRSDEILVRIVACGICHTDIALRDGLWIAHFPCVLGHEGAGVVEKVASKVKKIRVGDRVLLSFDSCGRCSSCRKNHPAHCSKFDVLNTAWRRPDGSATIWDSKGKPLAANLMGQSSLAYYALTHERNAIPIKVSEKELALFAPLGCGIQTGSGTVLNELKPKRGESIAIFGVGTVGLSAIMAARMKNINPIIAIDVVPSRLKLAKRLGAHIVINSKEENPQDLVDSVDNIVETTGRCQVIEQAMQLLSPRGKISLLAISVDEEPPLKPKLTQKIIESIAGDSHPQKFIPYLIRCYKKGIFPFDKMVRLYPASKINQAVRDSVKGVTIKPVLLFKK